MANMAKDGKSKLYSIFGGAANVAEWEKVCSKFRKVQWVKTGGKKLIYTHLSMPLTALDELRKAAEERNDDRYAALADIVESHQGLWCPEAEEYLLANFITEE